MTGKEKCAMLKSIRRAVAKVNSIEFNTTECSQSGQCSGTCPKCEEEAEYLDEKIDEIISSGGKVYIPDTYYQMKAGIKTTEKGEKNE